MYNCIHAGTLLHHIPTHRLYKMYGGTLRECKVRACRRLARWVEIDKTRSIILYTYICPRQGVPKCVRVIYGAQYE